MLEIKDDPTLNRIWRAWLKHSRYKNFHLVDLEIEEFKDCHSFTKLNAFNCWLSTNGFKLRKTRNTNDYYIEVPKAEHLTYWLLLNT